MQREKEGIAALQAMELKVDHSVSITIGLTHCMLGYKMADLSIWTIYLEEKDVVLETNRLESMSGPKCVGPDLGSSLFVILQKYC